MGDNQTGNRTQVITDRRHVLAVTGVTLVGGLAGCAALLDDDSSETPVDVLLQNDDTDEWQLTVAVEDGTGEEVFRTEETVPADDGEDLGVVRIEDAFKGTTGDQFTVQTWLDGEPAGTFDYEITCSDDNRFSLLIEHTPYDPDDGEPVDYVADRCA